jgi:predicted ATPase/DNA-binding SARP family transcriptional activator
MLQQSKTPVTIQPPPPGVQVTHRRQYTRCNRAGCGACVSGGKGHGPYWYAYWQEGGRLRSHYLGKQLPSPSPGEVADANKHRPDQGPLSKPTGSSLRVRTLGEFAVWRDNERIPAQAWSRRKAAALFKALLSARDYRLHRDQIVEMLWPEGDPARADSNLRFTLHVLRALLDPPDAEVSHVESRDRILILIPNTDDKKIGESGHSQDWLDAANFAIAAERALAGEDPELCKAALALYAGSYLPEDRYEDWVLPRSEELARRHCAVMLHRARLLEKKGSPEATITAWHAVLAMDPCHEEAAYALMRCLGDWGKIAEALRIHAALTAALARELAVKPAQAIERLRARLIAHQQAVTGDTDVRGRRPPPAPKENTHNTPRPAAVTSETPVRPLTNIPTAMTSFVGRRYELAAVQQLLLGTRLLTLTGIGGSGKTRLATHVAGNLGARFPAGSWLVELAAITDSAGVLELVAGTLGMPDLPANRPLLAGLIQYLLDRELLLVLDNCEHLLDACAELVDALLNGCSGLRILATSRESLDIAGEITFRVPPLSLPALGHVASAEELIAYEAVQLFVERARAHRPGFTISERNVQAVSSICSQLDGLPLAIELAAARTRALAVEDIDARLDRRFQLLTGGPRTALPRHQTLRGALDWSYDLLTTKEQILLRRLSVFAGGWTVQAAETICAGEPIGERDVLDILSMLVNKSLVELDDREDGARYRLQETMRQYALEKLMQGKETADIYERHLAWCLTMAEDGATALLGPDQFSWLNRLTVEHENLRAALSWSTAIETQRGSGPATGLRLAGALWRFWWMRGFPHEGRRWLEMSLGAATSAPVEIRARALGGAGVLAADQGDYARARTLHEESLALWRSVGDVGSVAGALNNLGSAVQQQGDHRTARLLHEESLALWRAQGDVPGIAGALNQLACIARDDQSDYALASLLLEESLALRRSLNDVRGIAISLNNQGLVAYFQGDYTRARTLLEESLALRRSLGDTRGIANSLGNLGRVAVGSGDHMAGHALIQQSLLLRRDQGDRRGIVECLEGLAMVAALNQEPARATRLLGAAEALREAIGFADPRLPRDMPDQVLADLCLELGDEAFTTTWAEGRTMDMARAVAVACDSVNATNLGKDQANQAA